MYNVVCSKDRKYTRFTKTAVEFVQIRPIDLIDQHELTRLLPKISS